MTYTITAILPADPELDALVNGQQWPVSAWLAREHWTVLGAERSLTGASVVAAIAVSDGRLVPVTEIPGFRYLVGGFHTALPTLAQLGIARGAGEAAA